MKSVVLLLLIGLVTRSLAVDYCSKDLCGSSTHIACNNTGDFAETCSSDRDLVEITVADRKAIVQHHNQLRNDMAAGKLEGFEQSPRMASMQWDAELAKLAELNVKTCKFAHDACHNTVRFPYSGQNLGELLSNFPHSATTRDMMISLIDSWWSEKKDTTMKEINEYPRNFNHVIGHFTVMAVEDNNRVGCAASTFRDPDVDNYYAFLFACNYAKTNIINGKTYSTGNAASKCKTGSNRNFNSLCSIREKY
ncbi:antigen 5 like allergen Cul n 1-like [Episyrphus balteatus]|uniref:antigen 5 like allergen Cul n 1-like n=1 Tax=Episyrphus balteatus TaxID=286459 RepID=UPI0024853EC9|nr:antigen 5 like allergen Cul n 1-like [Episyrphus balteatus]